MHMGGAALHQAAQMVIAKGRSLAAHLLQADPDAVIFADGRFTVGHAVGDSDRGIDLLDLAASARDPANLPDGMTPGLDADAYNPCDEFTFPNGCHAAEVEIDPETGAVTLERYIAIDDYGHLINPMLTSGQVQGGLAQGIGQAMLEHTVYDADSGQLLSGSLMDYALPRADDLPPLEVTLAGVPTARNPLGVKGSGQAGLHRPRRRRSCTRSSTRSPRSASTISTCRQPPSASGALSATAGNHPSPAATRHRAAQPPLAPNSASSASRTVSRSSRCASIIGAVSTMISSMSPISLSRL